MKISGFNVGLNVLTKVRFSVYSSIWLLHIAKILKDSNINIALEDGSKTQENIKNIVIDSAETIVKFQEIRTDIKIHRK